MPDPIPPRTIRVFVDGAPLSLPPGSRARDAVAARDPSQAERLAAGTLAITDARGLPVAPDAPVAPGTILRVVRSRPDREPGD